MTVVYPDHTHFLFGYFLGLAVKECTPEGSWYKQDNRSISEWTDYTPCLNYEVCIDQWNFP